MMRPGRIAATPPPGWTAPLRRLMMRPGRIAAAAPCVRGCAERDAAMMPAFEGTIAAAPRAAPVTVARRAKARRQSPPSGGGAGGASTWGVSVSATIVAKARNG